MALRRPRVVIIDDDARVASMLVEVILTLLTPCSVETASNGEAGLAAIRGERPDLVLLDLRMPGLDGVEVLKRIRDIDAGIAVIVISGAGDLADPSSAWASGALACLSVLAEPHVLEFLVRVVIRRRHVVLHLRPVHDAPRPPDARDVVHVPEYDSLDLVDELLAFGGIQSPRLAREEVVDPRIGESPPVVAVARGVPLEELVRVVHEVERGADDQLEVAGVPAIREPGRRLEGSVLGLDADLPPLLDHEHAEAHVRDSDVAVFQYRFEAVGVPGLGQEAFGLGAILLHVLPEARKL